MDYEKTVNLPKTSFPMKGNLPTKEPGIIEFWEKTKRSLPTEKKKTPFGKFILHDGPPYANGHIHIGTALNKILKDIVVRYFSLSGYETPFTPGWDCHGLPIEQNVLKEIGQSSPNEGKTDTFAPVEFRRKAAAYARRFVQIQKEEFRRLGVSADWDKPYLTLEPYYEAAIVEVFGRLVSKGMIYRRKKPVYWCPTCRTALADAEVEYAEHISDDIFVKFRISEDLKNRLAASCSDDKIYALIWTTTPWTLPANVALAFHPAEKYSLIKIDDPRFSSEEKWIVASKLKDNFLVKNKILSHAVVGEFIGSDFEGMVFSNPLNGNKSVGVLADFVSMEDGSGIVHIAPGHGTDDYLVGLKYNLPTLSPVDGAGIFTDEAGEFKGHKVFAANHLIVEKLSQIGALVGAGKITHSYPHCWRCKRAIIFRATEQWFLDVTSGDFKKRLLDAIEKVKWIPAYGKNRISAMSQERPDWCLSRQRLWGTPIPVFYCESCQEAILPDEKTIKGIAKLFGRDGSDVWFEKSTREILELSGVRDMACPKCSSKSFRKETDIFDVWFDSGVSSFAVLDSDKFDGLSSPADLYLEGSDQHRGWFQTSLIPSVALREGGVAPYKTVLTHGFVVDGEGKKMSKSLQNVISPDDVIKNYGADILRLWVAASDYSEDIRLSKDILAGLTEIYRKIRNTLRYILGNISDMPPEERVHFARDRRPIDRYIWTRSVATARLAESAYKNFEFHKVVYHLNNFCVNDLSSFYFDVLKDCLYTFRKDSFSRRSAQSTLEDIFLMLEKYIAPILPFTAEEAWQSYKNDRPSLNEKEAASVFEKDFASEEFSLMIDKNFDEKTTGEIAEWEKILEARKIVNVEIEKFRASGAVGSSLECKVRLLTSDEETRKIFEKHIKDLPSAFIVSSVEIAATDHCDASSCRAIIAKADGKKCPRCWNWRDDVGENPERLDVCRRCYEAILEYTKG